MEIVGCEIDEARSPDVLASWVVHTRVMTKIKELLDTARSHVNTFEETVEQTL